MPLVLLEQTRPSEKYIVRTNDSVVSLKKGKQCPKNPDAMQDLNDFEIDALEAMIAGALKTQVIVGDGEFAELAFGSLRDRVEPQSALAEIDARVAERAAAAEAFVNPKSERGPLH